MSHDIDDDRRPSDLSDREDRALMRLVGELRAAPAPELEWDRVETELLRRTELEAAARRRRRPQSSWGSLGAFAAAAAAVVMLISGTAQQDVVATPDHAASAPVDVRSLATIPRGEGTLPLYQVQGLAPHSVIESEGEPLQLTLEGVATWTLGPHSRAIVHTTTRRAPHVVELVEGSLFAEVVPRHSADEIVESFVVEVGGMRVAVHGTVFSVIRVGEMVNVEVTRGTVTVGPSSYRGATTGHLLVSPARATFDADTGAFVKRLPHTLPDSAVAASDVREPQRHEPRPTVDRGAPGGDDTAPDQPAVEGPKPQPTALRPTSSTSAGEPEPPLAPEPVEPTELPKLTVNQARGLVVGCLSGKTKRDEGTDTLVTISSQVTAVLAADGSVDAVRFSPPLRPDLQSRCGGVLFGQKIDAGGSVSFGVTFTAR